MDAMSARFPALARYLQLGSQGCGVVV